MKGVTIATSITNSTDTLYEQLVSLKSAYNDLLAENQVLKVENELLKALAGVNDDK